MYNENSIRVLSDEEAVLQSVFGIQEDLIKRYPLIDIGHAGRIAECCFQLRITTDLYERKYIHGEADFADDEQKVLNEMLEVFKARR